MFRARRALGVAGLLAFAAFAVPRVAPAFTTTYERVRGALLVAHDSESAALARFRSPEYAAAIQRVKDAIPRDASYYIVPADGLGFNMSFVRYDLAPRRPEKLGPAQSEHTHEWVVLSRIEPPGPEVMRTSEYLDSVSRP